MMRSFLSDFCPSCFCEFLLTRRDDARGGGRLLRTFLSPDGVGGEKFSPPPALRDGGRRVAFPLEVCFQRLIMLLGRVYKGDEEVTDC